MNVTTGAILKIPIAGPWILGKVLVPIIAAVALAVRQIDVPQVVVAGPFGARVCPARMKREEVPPVWGALANGKMPNCADGPAAACPDRTAYQSELQIGKKG